MVPPDKKENEKKKEKERERQRERNKVRERKGEKEREQERERQRETETERAINESDFLKVYLGYSNRQSQPSCENLEWYPQTNPSK